jgi:hypothetical protein
MTKIKNDERVYRKVMAVEEPKPEPQKKSAPKKKAKSGGKKSASKS